MLLTAYDRDKPTSFHRVYFLTYKMAEQTTTFVRQSAIRVAYGTALQNKRSGPGCYVPYHDPIVQD